MPKRSTSCDIDAKGDLELSLALFDAGLTHEAFYWTAQGKVALVAVAGGIKTLVLEDTPMAAIRAAEIKLTGGL